MSYGFERCSNVLNYNWNLKLEACWTIPVDAVNFRSCVFESIGCQQLASSSCQQDPSCWFQSFLGCYTRVFLKFPCLETSFIEHMQRSNPSYAERIGKKRLWSILVFFFDFGNRTPMRQPPGTRQTGSEGRSDACDRWEAYRSISVQSLHYDHVLKQNLLPNHLHFVRVNSKSLDDVKRKNVAIMIDVRVLCGGTRVERSLSIIQSVGFQRQRPDGAAWRSDVQFRERYLHTRVAYPGREGIYIWWSWEEMYIVWHIKAQFLKSHIIVFIMFGILLGILSGLGFGWKDSRI